MGLADGEPLPSGRSMSYHYMREPGSGGRVTAGRGAVGGRDLAELLIASGRPPLKVSLELVAAVAEILEAARRDGAVHGDIKPGAIRVDSRGAVSVLGYGSPRRSSRAPEDQPASPPTDIYGLGVLLYSLIAPTPLGRLPRDRDAHRAAVLSRLARADYGPIGRAPWLPDLQGFLASILSFDPSDRPAPADVAAALTQVAQRCPGESLGLWAAGVAAGDDRPRRPAEQLRPAIYSGPGERAPAASPPRSAPTLQGLEDFLGHRDPAGDPAALEPAPTMVPMQEPEPATRQLAPGRRTGSQPPAAPRPPAAPSSAAPAAAPPTATAAPAAAPPAATAAPAAAPPAATAAPAAPAAAPPGKRRPLGIVLLIVGGLALVGALGCAGILGLMIFVGYTR